MCISNIKNRFCLPFENTHEAIIDKETWELVQKNREQRRRPTKLGEMGMFSGLAYCADCGAKLSDGYEKEQAELKQSIEELREVVAAAEAQTVNIQSFMKIVKKYTEPTELNPTLLREFVEKVVVHAPDKSSGHRVQRIDVHYNFIGEIGFSPEFSQYSKKTTV